MACNVLVFLRWPAEALGAEIAAVWVILGVDGNDVSLKARGISCAVITILTLIHPPLPVHFGQNLFPSVSTQDKRLLQAFFVRERRLLLRFFGVDRQDVAAEHERISDPEAAMATMVQFFGLVSGRVLFELGGPVEAFPTRAALMRVFFSVNGNDVALQVAGVGAAMLAVHALVALGFLLVRERVLLKLLGIGEGLEAALALVRRLFAVLGLHVRLQVGRVGRFVAAVQARVRLFPGVSPHVLLELRRVPEALPALHADVREVFTVYGQQVPVKESLLGRLVIAELAAVHFGGGGRWNLQLRLSVMVLVSVRQERHLLVELFAAHLALERCALAAHRVDLHVIVEAGFLVGGEVTVCTLVLLLVYDILVMVLGVALQKTSRFEFLSAQHAWIHCERLSIWTDDNC